VSTATHVALDGSEVTISLEADLSGDPSIVGVFDVSGHQREFTAGNLELGASMPIARGPPRSSLPAGTEGKAVSMRTRLVTVLASLFVVLSVLGAPAASANSTPGLVEKSYSALGDTLRARIAIEVNSASQGRYRFHLTCYYTDDNGNTGLQYCDMGGGTATWCDLTTGSCVSGTPSPEYASHDTDYTWTGSYRTLVNNHTYAAKMTDFHAYFYNSTRVGAQHTICTKKVTWHSGGSPTVGSAWC
jgi:hypothetical protein